MSTLDEASRQVESPLGQGSPFKFNKINDALLYGDIPKALLSVEVGDFGTEAASIEGELYVLPDTFIPYQDDYFFIKYLDKDLLFRVIGVTPDTIDGGANFYKINVKLDQYDRSIEDQVVETYNMIANNIGSNFNSIIRNSDYNIIVGLENVLLSLKEYYKFQQLDLL
jgi:tetrahydromethanopterin S-methyltransferase subunit G